MYEVQTYTLCDGWVNCWTTSDSPTRFHTKDQAEQELKYYLAEIEADPDIVNYDPDDFRIVYLGPNA